MGTVADALRRLGVDVSEDTLADAVLEAFTDHLSTPDAAALSPRDRALLTQGKLRLDARGAAARAAAESAAAYMAMVAGARTVAEVASVLGVDASRVRHRIAAGELYAIGVRGQRRLPAFQFGD